MCCHVPGRVVSKNKGCDATASENGACHHPNVCNPEHVANVEPMSSDMVQQCCGMGGWSQGP